MVHEFSNSREMENPGHFSFSWTPSQKSTRIELKKGKEQQQREIQREWEREEQERRAQRVEID